MEKQILLCNLQLPISHNIKTAINIESLLKCCILSCSIRRGVPAATWSRRNVSKKTRWKQRQERKVGRWVSFFFLLSFFVGEHSWLFSGVVNTVNSDYIFIYIILCPKPTHNMLWNLREHWFHNLWVGEWGGYMDFRGGTSNCFSNITSGALWAAKRMFPWNSESTCIPQPIKYCKPAPNITIVFVCLCGSL